MENDTPPSSSSTCSRGRKVVHSGERRMVYSVYKFLKQLSFPLFRETINFNQTGKLCATACGLSERTVNRINIEAKRESATPDSGPSFSTPGKERKQKCRVTSLDDFEKDVLRKIVFAFYDRGEFPSTSKITHELKQKINYQGSDTSTRRLLHSLGFNYRKTRDGRQFLLERNDIVAARIRFLRTMNGLRSSDDSRPVYYLDETWVNENHTRKYIWQDSNKSGGLKVPPGKGNRLIVCHVGSASQGFVKDCKWVFRSKTTSTDYHDEMNSTSFKEWFIKFLNLLEEGSVIVMDNAPYHSVLAEKIPNTSWRKAEIQAWLMTKKIHYENCETKPELLNKVLPFKSREKVYELDALASQMGHTVVRLPPYHCQYNPIELVWAQVKGEVASKNNTFKIKDVERLLNEALDNVTIEDWASRVRHAEKLQNEDFERECGRANFMESVTINLEESDDDSTDSFQSEDDERDYDIDEPLAMALRGEHEVESVKLNEIMKNNMYAF